MVADKIKNTLKNDTASSIAVCAFYFVMGFLLSIGSIYGGEKPFAVALVAVSKKRRYIFSLLGAVLGYLTGGFSAESARYISAVIIAGVGALAGDAFKLNHSVIFPMVIGGIASLVTGLVMYVELGAGSNEYLALIGEAILTLGACFFYFKSLNANFKRLRFKALPVSDIVCIIISLSTAFMELASVRIGMLCPVASLAVLGSLFCVKYAGERWGLLISVSLGFALSIGRKSALFILGAMVFSTLVASLFTGMSCVALAISYICSAGFFAVAGENAGFFLDSLIGAITFVLVPSSVCDKIADAWDKGKDITPDGALRQSLVLKLRFASTAMAAISESVEQVREKIIDITRRENESQRDIITEEEYIRREIVLEKTNQIRMVASDQFFSISDMLDDLATEFDDAEIFDSNASARIRRLLGDYDIYPLNISAIEDKYGRMRVEILVDSSANGIDDPSLCTEIGKICSRYFERGRITNFKNESMLSFSERPNYKLSVGFCQHSAEGELCGDTVKVLNDNKGHSILIISDGMGKGSRAALDGAMGAGLLSRLINAGFGFDSSLKVVNSALLVKSNDESLATIDIANVDLFTGKCEIFKAGAPAGYIIKDGSATKCELTSMPAGILRGIEFAKRTAVLRLDDMIVMMSDGITDLNEDWLHSIVLEAYYMSPQDAADHILDSALKFTEGEKIDDMSVICARLERN